MSISDAVTVTLAVVCVGLADAVAPAMASATLLYLMGVRSVSFASML